jgi:hypothetical protein
MVTVCIIEFPLSETEKDNSVLCVPKNWNSFVKIEINFNIELLKSVRITSF